MEEKEYQIHKKCLKSVYQNGFAMGVNVTSLLGAIIDINMDGAYDHPILTGVPIAVANAFMYYNYRKTKKMLKDNGLVEVLSD